MPTTTPFRESSTCITTRNELRYYKRWGKSQADRIDRVLETRAHSVEDMQTLTNSLAKTVEGLQKVSAVDEPVNLFAPQLVGVLERWHLR